MTLFDDFTAWDNLQLAWRMVRRNVPRYRRARSAGPDGVSLADFERQMPRSLRLLQQALREETYVPRPPGRFSLPRQGAPPRILARLNVEDRIAQRAALQVLAPLWEEIFLPCSFGYRPGRSVEMALEAVRNLREQGRRWALHGDVAACFDRLDHDILRKRLRRTLDDTRLLRLLDAWLEAGSAPAGFPSAHPAPSPPVLRRSAAALDALLGWLNHPGEEAWTDGEFLGPETARRLAWQDVGRGLAVLAGTWLRPKGAQAGRRLVSRLRSPAGGRMARNGAWLTGGLGALALGGLAVSWYLTRRAGNAPAGVLQGSPLSPLLANIYLHPFDVGMTRAGYALVRFADDWVVCAASRKEAESARLRAERLLKALRLEFNPRKTRLVSPAEPLPWLGDWVP